jgi:putative addiction module component (TIGR02574 family)
MSNIEVPADILALPVADRIELVSKIWDTIGDDVAINEEHQRILEKRLAEYRANPVGGISWEELKAKLRSKP